MKIPELLKGAKGFSYDDSPQRSPQWLHLHAGRVGASRLKDWLAVSKRDGKPLKARSDYERELAFERTFGVSFSRYVTGAMQEGIDNEGYVREQYAAQTGNIVREVGAFYNDYFIASPDGLVGDDGGVEIKWLQDSNWTEVLVSGKPLDDHMLQIQGNLYASGRKWWDYIAANGNTGRFIVIRVERDESSIKSIRDSLPVVATIEPLKTDGVFALSSPIKENLEEVVSIW